MEILEEFSYYAGYKINITKTQLWSFNYTPSKEIRCRYDVKWDMESIKYLRVHIVKTNYMR